jgi:hypothetical protein
MRPLKVKYRGNYDFPFYVCLWLEKLQDKLLETDENCLPCLSFKYKLLTHTHTHTQDYGQDWRLKGLEFQTRGWKAGIFPLVKC